MNLDSVENAQTVEALLAILVQVSAALEEDKIQPIDAMRINAAAQRKLKKLEKHHNSY